MRAYGVENLSLSLSYVDNDETVVQACANATCTRDRHVYGTYYPVIRT